ncbi:MAG: 50S ribosomal protein L24 [Verrucomicrobia bacterium]|nr:MAG: 50S ribosomal protein L24 [Verrucomicrobiota bacterium]
MSKHSQFHIKRGDLVEVTKGDDAGKTGKVLQILAKQNRAVVEGLNQIKKHLRKTQDNPKGGIVEKEAPIAIANLKLKEAGVAEKRLKKVKDAKK